MSEASQKNSNGQFWPGSSDLSSKLFALTLRVLHEPTPGESEFAVRTLGNNLEHRTSNGGLFIVPRASERRIP
jgi:hypothetical protein